METEILTDKELLFEEDVSLTGITDYGFTWKDFMDGVPVPEQGARFDIAFEGAISGDKLSGRIYGIDYLEVRADGKMIINLHAGLVTSQGERINVTETGINRNGDLRLNIHFHTGVKQYVWLNQVQVWAIGKVDFNTGKVHIKGYLI
jgi:hypothetical protein